MRVELFKQPSPAPKAAAPSHTRAKLKRHATASSPSSSSLARGHREASQVLLLAAGAMVGRWVSPAAAAHGGTQAEEGNRGAGATTYVEHRVVCVRARARWPVLLDNGERLGRAARVSLAPHLPSAALEGGYTLWDSSLGAAAEADARALSSKHHGARGTGAGAASPTPRTVKAAQRRGERRHSVATPGREAAASRATHTSAALRRSISASAVKSAHASPSHTSTTGRRRPRTGASPMSRGDGHGTPSRDRESMLKDKQMARVRLFNPGDAVSVFVGGGDGGGGASGSPSSWPQMSRFMPCRVVCMKTFNSYVVRTRDAIISKPVPGNLLLPLEAGGAADASEMDGVGRSASGDPFSWPLSEQERQALLDDLPPAANATPNGSALGGSGGGGTGSKPAGVPGVEGAGDTPAPLLRRVTLAAAKREHTQLLSF